MGGLSIAEEYGVVEAGRGVGRVGEGGGVGRGGGGGASRGYALIWIYLYKDF